MNLNRVKAVQVAFYPLSEKGASARLMYGRMVAEKTRNTYPNLKVKIERLDSAEQMPWMQVTFSDGSNIKLETANFNVAELVQRIERKTYPGPTVLSQLASKGHPSIHLKPPKMMLISKADIKLIYQNLFQEGVMVIKKDFLAPAHEEVPVQNLKVIKCLISLKSRGYVTEQFNWQYYYYFLTDAGIEYLRGYLHLPETAVPATVAKANKNAGRYQREGEEDGEERRRPRRQNQEGEYRRGGFRQAQSATA